MIRVLIADDEPPARQRLRQLLGAYSGFEVVAEAETGAQTMEFVASAKPDLLLLDIQMSQGTGLDVAASLASPRPAIIFCTAFDQHAVDAFELNALDYLLKPVSRSRLERALARFPARKAGETDAAINEALRDPQQRLSRFLVRSGSRYVVIPASETAYFESMDGLTRLITVSGGEYWMDTSLQELEERVDSRQFFRVSRAALVNVNAITEVHALPGGSGAIALKTNTRVDVSRRRIRDLIDVLEKG